MLNTSTNNCRSGQLVGYFTSKYNKIYQLRNCISPLDLQQNIDLQNFCSNNFLKAYENIEISKLNKHFNNREDLKDFLDTAFLEEIRLLSSNKELWIIYDNESEVRVGLIFLEELDHTTIHVRQLLIDNSYQRSGISTSLFEFLKKYCSNIILDARSVSDQAIKFYEHMKFIKHEQPYNNNLSSEQYCSFTWNKDYNESTLQQNLYTTDSNTHSIIGDELL